MKRPGTTEKSGDAKAIADRLLTLHEIEAAQFPGLHFASGIEVLLAGISQSDSLDEVAKSRWLERCGLSEQTFMHYVRAFADAELLVRSRFDEKEKIQFTEKARRCLEKIASDVQSLPSLTLG